MIIEMLQVSSASAGPNSHVEYVFDKGGCIASFYAKNPPMFKSIFPLELSFEGQYKGKDNYKIIAEKINICPEGYEENKFGVYVRKNEDGTKNGVNKYVYNFYDENHELIGTIKHLTVTPKKQKLFQLPQTYEYKEFTFKGQKYELYDVRKRGLGVFYCIYKDNNLVAMIEKNLHVVNWLDSYKIYALDDLDIDFLCLAASYYDFTNFEKTYLAEDGGPGMSVIQTGDSTVEWRKEILDKYDPEFKNKIISMEK